ncbi:hypothetical protein E4Z66_12260 [Aliishimia ponticola]|uniref:5-bromo-4-chloroindolyl phosphate hydrolysis protein n=1 Tax=Aliishimia ponticola TaxID=2499833 RepID=A0A4S4N9C8_9RHOB|nr:5-bromo-4-chloroindolyl phosphate hydrolysis family protein [Aliishimia ponticola]THH35846.1 hypothetical protein E4Z66_12260 [Aliishimia ponticola]
MNKRYGGKYSPDGSFDQGADGKEAAQTPIAPRIEVNPVGARANVLFIPAIPLVFTTLNNGAVGMALGLVGAGLLTLAAFLLRGGLEAAAEYEARRVARRPAFPRKMAASLLTGLGVCAATLAHGHPLLGALIFGAAAGALHVAAFGIDPLRNKGMEGIDTFQQDRVARVVDEAEKHLNAMEDALRRAGDRRAEAAAEQFRATVRDLVRTVEEDPRDLTAARKYLGVYLIGARDAAVKFADLNARAQNPEAQQKFIALLSDLQNNFAAKTRALMADSQTDLDIEISVLRDRLAREGVRLDT